MLNLIFINKFQDGSAENPNVGMGTLVGIDTYSKKGVARLAKKGTVISSNFTSYPTFFEQSGAGTYIWVQCADGSVLYSSDGGSSWQATNTAFPVAGHGNGMIFFQNYMIAFIDAAVYYWLDTAGGHGNDPTSGSWVNWTSDKTLGALQNFVTDPISAIHYPFLFPNNRGVYFGNGGSGQTASASSNGETATVGFFGQVGSTKFDPAGALGTNFLWNNGILSLPSFTYTVGSINFLPPSQLAITINNWQNPSQGADLITWDTVTTNKFSPPLRIYSDSLSTSTASGATGATAGLKQLFNRNQVLYSITGGNHSIYETNGSTFNLDKDIALFSSVRSSGGGQLDSPVYFNSFPSAITVIGNKLLTGVATMTNNSSLYPNSTTVGIFPIGVWTMSFNENGSLSTQCEFPLPMESTLISPVGTGNYAKITAIKSISSANNSTSQAVVGFAYNSATNPSLFGVYLIDRFKYIDNIAYTAIESELFEIGTPLNPQTVNNIEVNLNKKLLTGQSVDVSWRTATSDDWTLQETFVGDGTTNQYKITKNPIGATQFLQLRIRMATGGGGGTNITNSPELKTVIVS